MTVGDIAIGKRSGRDHSRVSNAHSVVHFVSLFQTTQNADRLFYAGFAHIYGLKATLQSRVFFDVLAVFIDGCRPDHVQFAARQHGFEHVAGVHCTLCSTGSNNGVHLIHEQDDLTS